MMRFWLQSFNGMEVYTVVAPLEWIQSNYDGEILDETKALTCWRPSRHAAIIWLDAGLSDVETAAAALAHEMIHLVRHMCQHVHSDLDSEVESSAYTVEYMFKTQLKAWTTLHTALMTAHRHIRSCVAHTPYAPAPAIEVTETLLDDKFSGGYSVDTMDKYQHVLDILNNRVEEAQETLPAPESSALHHPWKSGFQLSPELDQLLSAAAHPSDEGERCSPLPDGQVDCEHRPYMARTMTTSREAFLSSNLLNLQKATARAACMVGRLSWIQAESVRGLNPDDVWTEVTDHFDEEAGELLVAMSELRKYVEKTDHHPDPSDLRTTWTLTCLETNVLQELGDVIYMATRLISVAKYTALGAYALYDNDTSVNEALNYESTFLRAIEAYWEKCSQPHKGKAPVVCDEDFAEFKRLLSNASLKECDHERKM
jgi:hypothetical protein